MDCCKSNPHDYKYCAVCGNHLDRILCGCGYANNQVNIYCGNCGKQLDEQHKNSKFDSPSQVKSEKINLQELQTTIKKMQVKEHMDSTETINQSDINKLFSSFNDEEID